MMKGDERRTGQVAIVQQTFPAQVGAVQNAPGSSTVVTARGCLLEGVRLRGRYTVTDLPRRSLPSASPTRYRV
jgi:hypothetical protein